MQYRTMTKTNDRISVLGFGCMRFPTLSDKTIDEPLATKMVRHAIDAGVNYIDTAWPYHQQMSEPVVGRILLDGYRDKVMLATKLPSWYITNRDDMDTYLNKQLEKLQTDHIDYYLVHALNRKLWKNLTSHQLFDFLDAIKKDGRVRHVGFSFHDYYPIFETIVDSYDWDFCQIMYNYIDQDWQAGRRGLEYATQKGLGVIIMEPLRGGKITQNIPEDIQALWDSATIKRTPAAWAIHWLLNDKRIHLLLSGMSTMEQVIENLAICDYGIPNSLTTDELDLVERVRQTYLSRIKIGCTACEYCLPCPHGVAIPSCLNSYNSAFLFNDVKQAKAEYLMFIPEKSRASQCVACGECEDKCPQNLSIMDALAQINVLFETEEL